jgi:hypothetical protein
VRISSNEISTVFDGRGRFSEEASCREMILFSTTSRQRKPKSKTHLVVLLLHGSDLTFTRRRSNRR